MRVTVLIVILLGTLLAAEARADAPNAADGAKYFENQVQPILQAHCLSCHGEQKKVKGGLRLTSRETLLKGGNSGSVVNLDQPAESLLLQAIHYRDLKMPPRGKLPQAQLDVLTRWVKMGVPWSAAKVVARHGVPQVDDQARQFWSFRPVARPVVPAVHDRTWVANPIDAFILARLEAAGLRPAPPAPRAKLLRRL
jgi:mono/diheme cytochrome c family protein